MTIKESESAISHLPANELLELVAWLQEYHQQVWDKQIVDDVDAGRLDTLLAEVDKEYEAGLAQPQ